MIKNKFQKGDLVRIDSSNIYFGKRLGFILEINGVTCSVQWSNGIIAKEILCYLLKAN